MKECMFYEKLDDGKVQCHVCPRECVIVDGKRGSCRVRENRGGELVNLVYGKPCSIAIDPIEKKPLYHFFPSSQVYSLGTVGCNLHCKFCQNWTTSQVMPEEIESFNLTPMKLIDEVEGNNCQTIAYTYNEPIVFFEYVLDAAMEARKRGIRNVVVCNGFINQEPLLEWCKVIDAANIDLKGFSDEFYRKYAGAWLEPVLETLKTLKKKGVWLEITNLIIPGVNDDMGEIKKMCEWIRDNLGENVPLHFIGFYPCYKLTDVSRTSKETLLKAKEVADEVGLKYVYVGNAPAENNTYCPSCNGLLIKRDWFEIIENRVEQGKCKCGYEVDGVW